CRATSSTRYAGSPFFFCCRCDCYSGCCSSPAPVFRRSRTQPPLGTIGTPTNFWLLRQRGVVAVDEDRLVIEYLSSLRAGDASAAAGRV
ncbi:hypothetical protein EMIHUDRAFT_440177, partial [Emiliania huxleyi CCMP1516]|uniref:Uncharacterized protein n=2 Tax=Emiliania huxleyi TaxID=2903 RepID=A0A0D3KRI5_EMIH1